MANFGSKCKLFAFTACVLFLNVNAQENAGSSVAKSVIECYNNSRLYDRESRPPSTLAVLIELLRKIEDGPSIQNDREFAKEFIQRFRQDGIIKHFKGASSPYSLPFTPKAMQSDKNKILLTKLVPGSAINFPNETLTPVERCTMHFLLSNSIDLSERGDETFVCNKLSRFQRRVRRSLLHKDVEEIDPKKFRQSKGKMVDEGIQTDSSETDTDVTQAADPNSKSVISLHHSDCPVENGVIYTKWGSLQAGTVLAGIAAGREPQIIKTKDNYEVNSIYASTLTGDLAEAALWQGAKGSTSILVGDKGGWNNTLVPKWYFIERNSDWEVTDAEIRSGLDGLILAKNIQEWHNKVPSLRISQILDMYYSSKGVFSKKFRACNRNILFTEVAPRDTLIKETMAFSFLLDDVAKLPASLSDEGIKKYSTESVESLYNYITNLHDLGCEVEDETVTRTATDLTIILDTAWPFRHIQSALTYLLENSDINKYESNFTLISGKDFRVIVNSSRTILDFYEYYNQTVHSLHAPGFDYNKIFNDIEILMKDRIDAISTNIDHSGRSSVVLLVPYSASLSEVEKDFVSERREVFQKHLPDLKILVLGKGSKEAYNNLADSTFDIFSMQSTDGSNIIQAIQPLIARIKQIPRRIVNPKCGSDFSGSTGSSSLDQYVEPDKVNYYRIAPNYVFNNGEKRVKFVTAGYGNLEICKSEQPILQMKNSTTEDNKECQTITGEGTFVLDNACSGYDRVSSCPPIYFAVKAQNTNFRCSESTCRFPDNVKYTIYVENFGCNSRSYRLSSSVFLIVAAITYFLV